MERELIKVALAVITMGNPERRRVHSANVAGNDAGIAGDAGGVQDILTDDRAHG